MIKLDEDEYDTLELMAYVFGGIGGGLNYIYTKYETVPICKAGMADFASDFDFTLNASLCFAGLTAGQNDRAVSAINKRKNNPDWSARVSFEEYCAELNIMRGK